MTGAPVPTTADDPGVRPGLGVLLAACISTLVVNANTSAVSILIPSISTDLGAPIDLLQWAVTGYLLVGAATIVTTGALGDVFGRRRIFVAGLLLFVATSVLIALAPSGAVVVVGRVIAGAAGATILACGLGLLSVASSGQGQMWGVSLWGGASAVGAAAGPVIGGVLNELSGWQGLFWLNAVVAAACVPLTWATVAESSDPGRSRRIDWAGTALVAAILVPFVFAMTEGSSWGWLSLPTLTCLVISVLAAVGFVAVERRVSAPLIDLSLLRNVLLVGSTLAILIGAGAIAAISFLISLYFQNPLAFGMTSLEAGLATLPVAAAVVVVAPLVSPLAHKFTARVVVMTGFVLLTASFAVLAAVRPGWGYVAFLVPLLGVAAGLALSNGPASSVSTACVPANQVGSASGISNMARYVGGAVMTAVVAGIVARVAMTKVDAGQAGAEALAAGFGRACLVLAVFSACGILLGWLVARRTRRPGVADLAAAAASTIHTLPPGPHRPAEVAAGGGTDGASTPRPGAGGRSPDHGGATISGRHRRHRGDV
ncbi:MFS transporter [Actinomycetospora cinnamomea]|uniref:MFS transporter n=1 Tax=Actinomycetospora cinnamomea TaxID=663609 RepID=A0A2U1FLH1_9PSEU|nr:MFS transporter [Actinomycetospora cinnamomea]PVZ13053.1 MFS transporter [Actinomycetospora cinnamomea]